MNTVYRVLIGWWLTPIQEMFAEVAGYYQARNASKLEQELRALGLTDSQLDDVRKGALLIAQSGYTVDQVEQALIVYRALR
jgi:hypothetical protein